MLLPVAHAFGGRQDLPLPLNLFLFSVGVIVVLSFVGLAVGWLKPILEDARARPVGEEVSSLLINPLTSFAAGLIGVFLLGLTVYAGLEGTTAITQNFAVTFVFFTFWLGMVPISILLGDFFRPFNPWRAIALTVSRVFALIAGQEAPAPLSYPERLGRWPAALGLFGFLWLELVWSVGGGVEPRTTAIAALIYSALTFAGMALFGIERWLDRGESFSVYFGMFARLSPLTVTDGKLMVRRPLSGAGEWAKVPGSIAVLMVAIGGTSYDGASEGLLSQPLESVVNWINDGGLGITNSARIGSSIFLVAMIAGVAGIFWLGVRGMKLAERQDPDHEKRSLGLLGSLFAHSFIPIALAYLIAHYFTIFLYQIQAQFTYLLSDPLGTGADLFGTASGGIDYGIIGATTVFYIWGAVLAVGHGIALALGHDRALAVYGTPRQALTSQLFMLALMVAFSVFGLFLLLQPNA